MDPDREVTIGAAWRCPRRRPRAASLAASLLLVAALGGCGGSKPSSTTGTTTTSTVTATSSAGTVTGTSSAKPAYCEDAVELRRAVDRLRNVNLQQQGIAGAEAALREVQRRTEALVESAKSEFSKQTEPLARAASALAKSLEQASRGESGAVAAIPLELAELAAEAQSFIATAKCD